MDYIIGSLTTIVVAIACMIVARVVRDNKKEPMLITYSQSNIYERIKPAIPFMPPPKIECQSSKHKASQMIRIIMVGTKAYWISDSKVFEAPITPDGFVDQTMATPIDTMAMDKVELEEIAFIVEKLTEGKD